MSIVQTARSIHFSLKTMISRIKQRIQRSTKKIHRFVKFNDEKAFHHVFGPIPKIFQWKKHFPHRSIQHKRKSQHPIEQLKQHVFNQQVQSNRKPHHQKHQRHGNFVSIVRSQKIVFVRQHYLSILQRPNQHLRLRFNHIFHPMLHIHQVQ